MPPIPPDLIDPFHRSLYAVLIEDIETRKERLAHGSAATIIEGTKTVAEMYAAQTSYIQALQDVLDKCQELEHDRYGKQPTAGIDNSGGA